uniref:Uncharacterized protein n=1 Tax=Arundo donax TaxID=35708 RepID=A0A0A8YQY8_ARUDO
MWRVGLDDSALCGPR